MVTLPPRSVGHTRWRQLAEPSDQVLWVDRLTSREFKAGFGGHTPILKGQYKTQRYYSNFERAFGIMKDVCGC